VTQEGWTSTPLPALQKKTRFFEKLNSNRMLIDTEDRRHRLKHKTMLRKQSESPQTSESSKPFRHQWDHL
jgi:hypothetical protein